MYARTEPTPAPTRVWPISEADGQDGESCSSLPPPMCSRLLARDTAASEHLGTPASLPVIPGGSLIEKWVISCSLSFLVRRTLKGLKRPAALLMLPAIRPGLKGGRPPVGQAPPSGPLVIKETLVTSVASVGAE